MTMVGIILEVIASVTKPKLYIYSPAFSFDSVAIKRLEYALGMGASFLKGTRKCI